MISPTFRNQFNKSAVVAKQLLPTPEDLGLDPDISDLYSTMSLCKELKSRIQRKSYRERFIFKPKSDSISFFSKGLKNGRNDALAFSGLSDQVNVFVERIICLLRVVGNEGKNKKEEDSSKQVSPRGSPIIN